MELLSKKKIMAWIWTAVDRDSREIIDFEIGSRTTKTFRKLWERISKIDCDVFYSDNWSSYRKLIPSEKHVITKKETCMVESKNSQIRNYGSPFVRKTKCVSKKMKMIYYRMLLCVEKINEIARANKLIHQQIN